MTPGSTVDTLVFARANEADAEELTALHTVVARDLTARYGIGHWSVEPSVRTVAWSIRSTYVLVARHEDTIVATLQLQTKKPWAIDPTYFTRVPRTLYLVSMAVLPAMQSRGVGRRLLDEVVPLARDWPAQSIRLDAYDAPAGAGPFYAKSGYTERGRTTYRQVPLIYYELLL